ncbi:MAG: hypothetical protein ACIARR_04620 [Phycisphaerales bacterium JB059]
MSTPPTNRLAAAPDPQRVVHRRDLFWQNVIREILSALSVAAGSASGRVSPSPKGVAHSSSPVGEMFDGRLAVITTLGNRIPIADIFPVFACSIAGSADERTLSGDVQCTVFQIRTPDGEVFTLPVSEIRSFHSLSQELIEKLEARAEASLGAKDASKAPFGFAAFTSLANNPEAKAGAPEAQ